MTSAWKDLVRSELRARHLRMLDLALALGVHKNAIVAMLGPKQQTSAIVDAVCEYLNIPFPLPRDEAAQERAHRISQLAPEAIETIDRLIVLLARK